MVQRLAKAPATALLWAALLFAAQAAAVGHLHDDAAAQDAPCAVCTLAKSQTAASDTFAPQPAAPGGHVRPLEPDVARPDLSLRSAFSARAPPRA